jgi:hypothetical protein
VPFLGKRQLALSGGELRRGIKQPRGRFVPKGERSYDERLEKLPRHALPIEFIPRIAIEFATTD